jgi:F0F1-type ATP synthase delta subunit
MAKTVSITSAVALTNTELDLIKTSLSLSSVDRIDTKVDPALIAGIKVSVNGKTIDFSVKQQLAEIVLK